MLRRWAGSLIDDEVRDLRGPKIGVHFSPRPRESARAAACSHPLCGACAEPDDTLGPIQGQLGRTFYTLNVAGCIAVAQAALPEPEKCGETYNAAVQCIRESRSYGFEAGGTLNPFTECQKSVGTQGICKSYETAQVAACQGYKAAGSPALACFNSGSGEAIDAHVTRVVSLVCGPPSL